MELDKQFIENIIREVIKDELSKGDAAGPVVTQRDPSGVMAADPRKAVLQPFPFPVDAKRVDLVDLFTVEESPRLGAGIMELDDTQLEWTLTYDEIDYIIEGTLDILIDGRKVSAGPGEVILIPKNTKITFSCKGGKTRFLYVVYPANWPDLV